MFKNIHELCGPVMQEYVDVILVEERERCDKFLLDHAVEYNEIFECINYLLSLDDKTFGNIYITALIDNATLIDESIVIDKSLISDSIDIDDAPFYSKNCYISAFLSNINLLKKCVAISPILLNTALVNILLSRYKGHLYAKTDISCITLLYIYNFDSRILLSLAYSNYDYVSQKFIVERMQQRDFLDIINNCLYIGLIELFFIDKLNKIDKIDKLDSISTRYDSDKYFREYLCAYNKKRHMHNLVIECYHIINYMTIEKSKQYLVTKNQFAIDHIDKFPYDYTLQQVHEMNQHVDKLLEYHFRPRGSRTKAANTFSCVMTTYPISDIRYNY